MSVPQEYKKGEGRVTSEHKRIPQARVLGPDPWPCCRRVGECHVLGREWPQGLSPTKSVQEGSSQPGTSYGLGQYMSSE